MASNTIKTDLRVEGEISLTTVPNQTGTLLTLSSVDGETISTRTNTQIIADLGLEVTSNKASTLSSPNNTTYPTTLAVQSAISALDGNYVTLLPGTLNATSSPYSGDLNTINPNSQFWFSSSATNRPSFVANDGMAHYMAMNNGNDYTGMTVIGWGDDEFGYRSRSSGTWSNWHQVASRDWVTSQGAGNYIQNQTVANQSAGFRVANRSYIIGGLDIGTAAGIPDYQLHLVMPNVLNPNGIRIDGSIGNSASNVTGVVTFPIVPSGTSLTSLSHFLASQNSVAGSIGTQTGFYASNLLTGATNNYGFRGNIPAGTNRWNLYMDGTSQNYFAGKLGLGVQVPTEKLDVDGNGKFTGNVILNGGSLIKTISGSVLGAIIRNPVEYSTNGSSTGAIVIKHDVGPATMFDFKLKLFSYGLSSTAEIRISFYQQSGTLIGALAKSAYIVQSETLQSTQIRVGFDSTGKLSIILGDTSTAWGAYLRISVEEIILSYSGSSDLGWQTGWTTALETDLSGYTGLASIVPTIIGTETDPHSIHFDATQSLTPNQKVVASNNSSGYSENDATSTLDLNNETRPFIGQANSGANWLNKPKAGYFTVMTVRNKIANQLDFQMALESQAGKDFYIRTAFGGTWKNWQRLWNDADFTSTNITNWNTAYGWGDYSIYGLGTGVQNNASFTGDVTAISNTSFKRVASSATNLPVAHNGMLLSIYRDNVPHTTLDFWDDNGDKWLKTGTLAWRKIWTSDAFTSTDITNWNTAFSQSHSPVTLLGENYLSLSGQQITANPISLSGTNVTGTLPFARLPNVNANKLLGRRAGTSGTIEEITLGSNLSLTTGGLLNVAGTDLSLGTGNGSINSSTGSGATLTSLGKINAPDANADLGLGFTVYSSLSTATNFPSAAASPAGTGFSLIRAAGTNVGRVDFWSCVSNDDRLYFRTGAGTTTFNNWNVVADRGWVISQNYLTSAAIGDGTLTLSTGTGLSGAQTFTANQSTNATFNVSIASGFTLPTNTQVTTWNGKQDALSGTGFIKASGTAITYDNSTYFPVLSGDFNTYSGNTWGVYESITYSNTGTPSGITGDNYHILSFTNIAGTQLAVQNNTATLWIRSIPGASSFGSWIQMADRPWVTSQGYTTNTGTVTSVAASTTGTALDVAGTPITTSGTLAFTWAGTSTQYVNGLGNLTTFPTIPAQVNLSNGTGISISGTYPNLTITNSSPNATHTGDVTGATVLTIAANAVTYAKLQNQTGPGLLGKGTTGAGATGLVTIGSGLTLTTGNVLSATPYTLPIASATILGGIKVGTNLSIDGTGVLSSTDTTYTAGNGLTLSGTQFSLPVTISGTGTYVQSVVQNTNGITVTLGTPPNTVYTLPTATATVLGGIELFSNTVQSVAANAVSTTANRTYGVQLNSADQAVVNVPWTDTNTTYSGSTSISLSGTSFQRAALTGDVTALANNNTTIIAPGVVSNSKLADMPALSVKGNIGGTTTSPVDVSVADLSSVLTNGFENDGFDYAKPQSSTYDGINTNGGLATMGEVVTANTVLGANSHTVVVIPTGNLTIEIPAGSSCSDGRELMFACAGSALSYQIDLAESYQDLRGSSTSVYTVVGTPSKTPQFFTLKVIGGDWYLVSDSI